MEIAWAASKPGVLFEASWKGLETRSLVGAVLPTSKVALRIKAKPTQMACFIMGINYAEREHWEVGTLVQFILRPRPALFKTSIATSQADWW